MTTNTTTPKPTNPTTIHYGVGIGQLRIGDRIVTAFDETGKIKKSYKVTHLATCPGNPECIHVNKSACYDTRFSSVTVAR